MSKINFVVVDFNQIVPVENNHYLFPSKSINKIKNYSSYKKDGKTYSDCFSIVISHYDELSDIAAVCTLDSTLEAVNGYVSFLVLDRVEILEILDYQIKYDYYGYRNNRNDIELVVNQVFDKFKSIKLFSKEINYTEPSIEDFNRLAANLITDNTDLLSFFESDSIHLCAYLIYEYLFIYNDMREASMDFLSNPNYPHNVQTKLKEENKKLKNYPASHHDKANIEDYIDLIESIPWGEYSQAVLNIEKVKRSLDKSHYAMQEPKSCILDILAFDIITSKSNPEYLLFNGPPGTGKTSFAKTLAKILNRDYIYVSMAGLSDETELRGHRRTYVGSKPGRIVYNLSKITTMNPIIIFDEIDKIAEIKGSPENALLELLDPVQNASFVDRYLEIPLDLSKCLFICTSNSLKSISKPLLDRLTVIDFPDYNLEEKKVILSNYILPSISKDAPPGLLSIESNLIEHLCKRSSLREVKRNAYKILRRNAYLNLTEASKLITSIEDYKQEIISSENKVSRIGF